MKEDEANSQPAPTKSFMKKPKLTELASPKRLGTTLESDEFLDQTKPNMPDLNLDTNTNNNSVSASIESRNIKRRSISFNDGNGNQQESAGMAASQEYEEDRFDDETETSTVVSHSSPQQSRRINSERLNSRSSLKSSHTSERSNRLERNGRSHRQCFLLTCVGIFISMPYFF